MSTGQEIATRPLPAAGPDRPDPAREPWYRRWLRQEWILAILGGLLLAVVLTWPTLRDPRRTIPGDLGDPTIFAWQVAWGGHALLTNPLRIWHSNTFYPDSYTLAFTDILLGYAPAGMIGSGFETALLRYNILYVLLHALAFVGAYALVRQLGAGRFGAAVAGVAWAFAPWRLAHDIHLNVLSTGGIALCLAMLARGHGWSLRYGYRPERRRPGWALAGWLVGAWQVTLGLAIGLPFVYVLLFVCLVTGAAYGWSWWRRGARPAFGGRLLAADLAGGAVFGAATLLMGLTLLRVAELHPQARRSLRWTEMFSPPARGLFTAPATSWLWGDLTAAARERMPEPQEMALLPGLTVVVLAAIGLFFSVFRLRHRILLGLGVLGTALLSLGFTLGGDGDPGYVTLSKHLPGWDALRTPGRLTLWTTLLLAVLAAGAVSAVGVRIAARTGSGDRTVRPSRAALRAALLIPLALAIVEGVNRTPHPVVPPPPAALSAAPEPLLVLPSAGPPELNIMLWSADGFPRMVNGLGGFVPARQKEIRAVTAAFPDPASVAYLRELGIRSVVVLPDRIAGTPWAGVTDRPVDGLGITREEIGGAFLYRLG